VQQDKLIEVFDLDSDLQIYDTQTNEVITAPQVKESGIWETFPSFSPDGGTLYFCKAVARPIPEQVTEIRYNLCKVSFDPATGTIGKDVEVLIDAESEGRSISFPKPSFDGRFIMYTQSDYGNFSIWHHEPTYGSSTCRQGRGALSKESTALTQRAIITGVPTAAGSSSRAAATTACTPAFISATSTGTA